MLRSDSLISFDGYYSVSNIENDTFINNEMKIEHRTDTNYINCMFFEDGFFVIGNFYLQHNDGSFLKEIQNDRKKMFWGSSLFWGIYKSNMDTIKAQVIYKPTSGNDSWHAYEVWYKIINKNILEKIAEKRLSYDALNENKSVLDLIFLKKEEKEVAIFKSFSNRLRSDCWLKKRKWVWCSKKDFKEWKKNK